MTTSTDSQVPGSNHDTVIRALKAAGGKAHLRVLSNLVRQLREAEGVPLSATYEATIRREVQFSPFTRQDSKRSGIWRLATVEEMDEGTPPRKQK